MNKLQSLSDFINVFIVSDYKNLLLNSLYTVRLGLWNKHTSTCTLKQLGDDCFTKMSVSFISHVVNLQDKLPGKLSRLGLLQGSPTRKSTSSPAKSNLGIESTLAYHSLTNNFTYSTRSHKNIAKVLV